MRFCRLVLLGAGLLAATAQAEEFKSPDILVLGDSQISFGSGPVFVDFLSDLTGSCQNTTHARSVLADLSPADVGVIGVRSTSIHSWTARKGPAKGTICDVDKKWKVNAGTYGVVNKTGNEFKQMGQGRNYQFCEAGRSAFEAMFREDYYQPDLLVLTFLGNASSRWASSPEQAVTDVKLLTRDLPDQLPCVFMTTAPAYTKKVARQREQAQANIKRAFERTGGRCEFVAGITPETVATNQSTKAFFRRNKSGGVKDPYHPNERGARHHLQQRGPALCAAIAKALKTAKRS